MKDKPTAVFITLLGGLIACICCIIRDVGLLMTLLTVFISLVVFLCIGLFANKMLSSVHSEVAAAEKDGTLPGNADNSTDEGKTDSEKDRDEDSEPDDEEGGNRKSADLDEDDE